MNDKRSDRLYYLCDVVELMCFCCKRISDVLLGVHDWLCVTSIDRTIAIQGMVHN